MMPHGCAVTWHVLVPPHVHPVESYICPRWWSRFSGTIQTRPLETIWDIFLQKTIKKVPEGTPQWSSPGWEVLSSRQDDSTPPSGRSLPANRCSPHGQPLPRANEAGCWQGADNEMKNIRLETLQLLDKATTHTRRCQMSPGQEARASSPQGHRSAPAPAAAAGEKRGL